MPTARVTLFIPVFDYQGTALLKKFLSNIKERTVKIKTRVSGPQGEIRLVILNHAVQFIHLLISYVRRVGYDEVELFELGAGCQNIVLDHLYIFRLKRLRFNVRCRDACSGIADIDKIPFRAAAGSYDLISYGNTYAARAGAEISKPYISKPLTVFRHIEDVT